MIQRNSLAKEFWMFIRAKKAYWMIPIALVLLILVIFVVLGATGVAPFIYTLF